MDNTITTKKVRLNKLCKLYDASISDITSILQQQGFQVAGNTNDKLPIAVIDTLNSHFGISVNADDLPGANKDTCQSVKQWSVVKTANHYSSTSESVLMLLHDAGYADIKINSMLTDEQYDYVKEHKNQLSKSDSSIIDVILNNDSGEYVGIVKFYDGWCNMFGYLGTNTIIDGYKPNVTSSRYVSLRFERSDILGADPSDGSWVVFRPIGNGKKRSATSVRLLSRPSANDLDIVLRYIAPYSIISGEVGTYNVIDEAIKYFDGETIVAKFYSIIQNGQKSETALNKYLLSYLAIPNLRKAIIAKVTDRNFISNVSINDRPYFVKLISLLAESSVEIGDWSTLVMLRNLSLKIEFLYGKIKQRIVETFSTDSSNVFGLVDMLGIDECKQIFSYTDDSINSPELRAYFCAIFKDYKWIDSLLEDDWRRALKWLDSNRPEDSKTFISDVYKGKNRSFVDAHPLDDFGDSSKIEKLTKSMHLEGGDYPGVLSKVVEFFAKNKLSAIVPFLLSSGDYSELYPIISESLSRTEAFSFSDANLFVSELWKKKEGQDILKALPQYAHANTNELKATLFAMTQDSIFLESISDLDALTLWIGTTDVNLCRLFIEHYAEVLGAALDENGLLQSLAPERLHDVLETCNNEKEKLQLLDIVPHHIAKETVIAYYEGTGVYSVFIKKCWDAEQAKVPYVVFDLESDGELISEFAFKSEGSLKNYKGEEQIKSLGRVLKRRKIIVGHNIKAWDIPILQAKGIETSSFVWDTLEIELLLAPTRYAYSLHTTHVAEDDTELTDQLFWNQLYRLSLDKKLCDTLASLLPEEINAIIERLREPCFETCFRESANLDKQFFQTLRDIDHGLLNQLQSIQDESTKKKLLIVAPRNLWGRMAKYVSLRFPSCDEEPEYSILSVSKINSCSPDDLLKQTILKRFIEDSRTPVICSIAKYIRMNFFTQEELLGFCESRMEGVPCIDIDSYDKLEEGSSFDKIYFIGCELGERVHQYQVPGVYDMSFFLEKGCWAPMRLGASNYISLSQDDLALLSLGSVPSDIANIWIEKGRNNKLQIWYNYDFNQKRSSFIKRYESSEIINISWRQDSLQDKSNDLVIVKSQNARRFDSKSKRVGSTTRYKANYWVYQFKLLASLSKEIEGKPIIYIVDNTAPIDKLNGYAREIGWQPAIEGTIFKKLENIQKHSNSIYIIHQDDFKHIIDCREDFPYCHVWDNMSIDKIQMMWANQMPFGDEVEYNAECESHNLTTGISTTPKSCLLASWPVYQYYAKLITANCASSIMYVMDPYLDDYNDLGTVWNVKEHNATLWSSEKEYKEAVSKCSEFIPTESELDSKACWNDSQIQEAMETIRKIFLPKYEWRDYQVSTLPKILSKKTDYLISIPTGGGKSVLFQGPALYNSTFSNKLSIVITPLKALMEDQIQGLHDKGFYANVDFINGDRTYQEIQHIYRKINGGELALLYITPERFRSKSFINVLMNRIVNDNGLEYFIFDEAHCISQWGQEFRPEYLNVMMWCKKIKDSYPSTCVTLYSATVTRQIEDEIKKYLNNLDRCGQSVEDYNPIRSHIGMDFIPVEHDEESRTDAVIKFIESKSINTEKSRILVFCRTRKQCEETSAKLREYFSAESNISSAIDSDHIGYFHAGMDADDRKEAYEKYRAGDYSILCATKAFGMGMDISNIHYVLHFSPPSVLEDYLQEVGRAGRNKEEYQSAGFGVNAPIPTACLCSKEDFKRLKELLIKGMLTWANISDISQSIQEYITKLQSLETTNNKPVVVPFNLWKKEDTEEDTTAFRLGLYWLERLNRYKLGFLCPAHINIHLLSDSLSKDDDLFKTSKNKYLFSVYNYVKEVAKGNTSSPIQISINETRTELKIGSNTLLNCLILCSKYNLIKIEQSAYCRITNTRIDEVKYIFAESHERNFFALHMLFEMVKDILSECHLHEELIIGQEQRSLLLKDSFKNVSFNTVKGAHRIRGGKIEQAEYMPWYSKDEKTIGLCLADSYKKDFTRKRAKHIFTLVDLIPGVKLKSIIECREVKQFISLVSDAWKLFLKSAEQDCLKVLRYIFDKQNTQRTDQDLVSAESLNWSQAIIDLGLEEKGYQYFSDILLILKLTGYVYVEGLLPMGLEVYSTNETSKPILEEPEQGSDDAIIKAEFDESIKMKKIRLAAMDAFSSLKKNEYSQFITDYFKCVSNEEFFALLSNHVAEDSEFMKALREDAILKEENRLGLEQKKIYDAPINQNINVKAGPGSGKTHVLTLRCAKLIYQHGVDPTNILVLAYNRAVVVELKNRLEKLFGDLGLSRSASRLHVYTFHQMAKKYCGTLLNDKEFKDWEPIFLNYIKKHPGDFKRDIGNIEFILVDEFQDITQTRLDTLAELRLIFKKPKFFTIGDPDQSIYGFDKKIEGIPQSTNPDYYYSQLRERIHPTLYTMITNYRSYPDILKAAEKFLPSLSKVPESCDKLREEAPKEDYTYSFDNCEKSNPSWFADFPQVVDYAKEKDFRDIAVFFRGNNEVFRGYSQIKAMNLHDVRIRIQGATSCELYRIREIFYIIDYLRSNSTVLVELSMNRTKETLKTYIINLMSSQPNWDKFYLDVTYTLILDFLESISSDDTTYTYEDIANYIVESAQTDDGQIYKIYDRYREERIEQDNKLNIVLTTMHKVKGLEFDAVVITPSFASLPFGNKAIDMDIPMTDEEKEDLEEEKRLMYVAYTRAKKYLRVYTWKRELSLFKGEKFAALDGQLGYHDDSGLEKLYLSFLAKSFIHSSNDYIHNTVVKNDPVVLCPDRWNSGYEIRHNNVIVGKLAKNSRILREVKRSQNYMDNSALPTLTGFFINDIFSWSYEDTLKSDAANNTSFASEWCPKAINRGYIYVVDIAGYGHDKK